jgi:hypothetical protein
MHMDARSDSGFRRLAALICATAYLLGGAEVFPQFLALAACVEGSHRVQLSRDSEHVKVVLRHEGGTPGRPDYDPRLQAGNVQHRHGPAARVICLFAPQSPVMPDHVGQFAANPVSEVSGCGSKASVPSKVVDLAASAPGEPSLQFYVSRVSESFRPLAPPDSLLFLRSTVLVI